MFNCSWCRIYHQSHLAGVVVIVLHEMSQLHFYKFYLQFKHLRKVFQHVSPQAILMSAKIPAILKAHPNDYCCSEIIVFPIGRVCLLTPKAMRGSVSGLCKPRTKTMALILEADFSRLRSLKPYQVKCAYIGVSALCTSNMFRMPGRLKIPRLIGNLL